MFILIKWLKSAFPVLVAQVCFLVWIYFSEKFLEKRGCHVEALKEVSSFYESFETIKVYFLGSFADYFKTMFERIVFLRNLKANLLKCRNFPIMNVLSICVASAHCFFEVLSDLNLGSSAEVRVCLYSIEQSFKIAYLKIFRLIET